MKNENNDTVGASAFILKQKGDAQVFRLKSKKTSESILINLNWRTDADLDLGCFYELKPKKAGFFSELLGQGDTKSVIDGVQFSRGRGGPRHVQTAQGCYVKEPYIWHTGDDRSGDLPAGESILVNPIGGSFLKRMTIYAFIYEGAKSWSQTDAVVTVRAPGNPDIVIRMGRQRSAQTLAAIAGIEFLDEESVRVTKLLTFHEGHDDCDRAYGWGLSWRAGGK